MLQVPSYRPVFERENKIYPYRNAVLVGNRRGRDSQSFRGKRSRLDPNDSSEEMKRDKRGPSEDDASREGKKKHPDVKDEDVDNASAMASQRDFYRKVT